MKTNQAKRNSPPHFPRVGTRCPSCNDMLLAPAASEYVNEREVRHFWSCDACGHELATSIDVLTQVELEPARGGAAWKASGTRALESAM